jgi:hypothetical protein
MSSSRAITLAHMVLPVPGGPANSADTPCARLCLPPKPHSSYTRGACLMKAIISLSEW